MAIAPTIPISSKGWTDQDLMALPDDGNNYELVDGELVMSSSGLEHGYIEEYVLVYKNIHKPSPDRLLSCVDSLSGEEILPNFSFPVADLFPELNF